MSDLVGFERAAYRREPDRVRCMIDTLWALALSRLVEDAADPSSKDADQAPLLLRLATAIAAVVAEPDFTLSDAEMDELFLLSSSIKNLFAALPFGNTDFILRATGERRGISRDALAGRLPFLSMDSEIRWPPAMLGSLPPARAQQFLAQMLGTKPILTMAGQARFEALLDYAPSLPPAEFPRTPDHLVLISSAWMLCSYASTPGKHAVKHLFNATLRDMALRWGFSDIALPAERPRRDRPVLLFAAEIMHSGHVQYRYFGQYLRQLRTRFELVLLTEDAEVDDLVSALFDRVLTFKRKGSAYLDQIYRMILDTAPDIIFWPSVGMRHWGPLFANLRLAPIQMTALGHSASTFCPTIDYYLLEEGYVSDPALFGETVITVPDDSLIFERASNYTPLAPEIRTEPQSLRIAVPSNMLKLNPSFIATLGKVRAAAKRPIEFHFMPNAIASEAAALRTMAQRHMPGAHIHPKMPYARYLTLLSACDVNLSPFPFGGLHSVIDSLRQGLPVIAMECPEPHGRTDAMLLRRLGMPEWLIARTEDDYIAAALRVIGDDGLRVALSEQALALDIDRVMFGDADTELRHEIVDAVGWIYAHHEDARQDGRKLWSLADRAALS